MAQDTLPMPLESLSAARGGLDEFRITSPREVTAMLKQFQDGNVMLNLNGSSWGLAAEASALGFASQMLYKMCRGQVR